MPHPGPVMVLGRLAIDADFQGRGLAGASARRHSAHNAGSRYRGDQGDPGPCDFRGREAVLRALRISGLAGRSFDGDDHTCRCAYGPNRRLKISRTHNQGRPQLPVLSALITSPCALTGHDRDPVSGRACAFRPPCAGPSQPPMGWPRSSPFHRHSPASGRHCSPVFADASMRRSSGPSASSPARVGFAPLSG